MAPALVSKPMSTEPLVKEIERAFPDRPFTIELWDGSKLPSTNGGGPTFKASSRDALAYAVAAPGQLGLGRAYVSGEIEIDDMDAVIGLFNDWKPPCGPPGSTALPRRPRPSSTSAAASTPPSGTARPSATTTTSATSSSRSSSTGR